MGFRPFDKSKNRKEEKNKYSKILNNNYDAVIVGKDDK